MAPLIDYAFLVVSPACFARAESRSSLSSDSLSPPRDCLAEVQATVSGLHSPEVSGELHRLPSATGANEETVMGRRLYVGNLPYTTGEAELQELFAKAGNVESVRVMRDAATGRARGFAFVEMSTDEEAQKAATEFNQFQMGGRALTVN